MGTRWHPLFEEGGDDGGGGGGGGEATATKPESKPDAGFMSMKLEGESIPAKLAGKTGADLLKSYLQLEQRSSKLSDEVKTLKQQMDESPRGSDNGVDSKKVFANVVAQARESGQVDPQLIEPAAQMLGVRPEDIQLIAKLTHQHVAALQDQAKAFLLSDKDIGYEVDVAALAKAAQESGIYTEEDLVSFDRMFNRGIFEPLKVIVKDLESKGVDVRNLSSDKQQTPAGRGFNVPNIKTGNIDSGVPELRGFKTRSEFLTAQKEAIEARRKGDSSKMEQVKARLDRSDRTKWPDRQDFRS